VVIEVVARFSISVMLGLRVNQLTRREVGVPGDIISVGISVLVIIVWILLLRRFVYPRFSRRRAENLQLARLVYSGVLAVALVFVAEMLTLSGPLEDPFDSLKLRQLRLAHGATILPS
jgi:hypothetical protein